MKNLFKYVCLTVMLFSVFMTGNPTVENVSAASIDVTLTYKDSVKRIVGQCNGWLALYSSEGVNFTFNARTKTSMACYNIKEVYDQEKNELLIPIQSLQKKMEEMYGEDCKINIKNTKKWPDNVYYKKNGKILSRGGDWGDAEPIIKIEKVFFDGKNTFCAKVKSGVEYYGFDGEKNSKEYMREYYIYLKRSNGKSGFLITNIKEIKTFVKVERSVY